MNKNMIIIRPLIELFLTVISLYKFALTIWIIMSWLSMLDIIKSHNPIVKKINEVLNRLIYPAVSYIRSYIPPIGGLDLSAIVIYLLLNLVSSILISILSRTI